MQISSVKTESYNLAVMQAAVRRHFDALDVRSLLFPGARVVLKPNLLMKRAPESATTTSPILVEAVALCLRELGAEHIVIADSPGGPYTKAALEGVCRVTGMAQAAQDSGAALNEGTGYQSVDNGCGDGLCSTFNIIDPVAQADVVINLPKLKTHAMTTMSAGVKNLLGCVPGLQKPELHFRFPERERFGRMLVELARTVGPQLTIVDAVVTMEGDGPSGGTPRQDGWTFASRDIFALDLALCRFMGLDPMEVPTTAYALANGIGPGSHGELEYLGDGMPEGIRPFVRPRSRAADFSGHVPGPFRGIVRTLGKRLFVPRPFIRRSACIGCGKCAESCPAHTIDIKDKKAYIRDRNCIKCYCCHEMCPVQAIGIKRMGRADNV